MDAEVVERASRNVVRVDVLANNQWGRGSGLLIDNGTVLTCGHVIHPFGSNPQDISIVKRGQLPKKAEIVKVDQNHDLAIIRCERLTIDGTLNHNNNVKVGHEGFILGFPIGISHLTLTKAVVSAKGIGLETRFQFELIQIDARVNHGNSGGPLFTDKGEVAGIVTLKYIPFLEAISELHEFVKSLPLIPEGVIISGVKVGPFVNYVNEGIKRMTNALDIVQVGIGWVIPIRFSSSLIS